MENKLLYAVPMGKTGQEQVNESSRPVSRLLTLISDRKKFPSSVRDFQQAPWATVKPNELIRIFGAGMQIIRWQRDAVIKTCFQQMKTNDLVGSGFCTIIRVDERLKLNILPNFAGRRAMVEDISMVSDICLELLRCQEIVLRLEVLGGAMYPRFHVDRSAKDSSCIWKYSAVPCVCIVM
jgi:hypothetical protein